MKNIVDYIRIIEKFQNDMSGVFTLSDLKAMLPCEHLNTFYRAIATLEKNRVIKRFTKGIYVTEKFDLAVVSQKLYPLSYISFESVLARELIIGTTPQFEIRSVKIGKRREYLSQLGNVLHLGVAKHLFFGFETIGGVNFADKEKAVLDTLYFFCKGQKFFFDIYSDMNLKLIDKKKINGYLKKYKNPKFVKFVEQFLKTGGL